VFPPPSGPGTRLGGLAEWPCKQFLQTLGNPLVTALVQAIGVEEVAGPQLRCCVPVGRIPLLAQRSVQRFQKIEHGNASFSRKGADDLLRARERGRQGELERRRNIDDHERPSALSTEAGDPLDRP
jgi:hypothetical protein